MPYQILTELGKGSFGVVYLLKLPNRREYALKVIQIVEPDESDLARRESELMLELEHPHILQCCWVGMQHQQLLFLLLEYCERGTLTNAIKKYVSEEQAMIWFIQMADALKYLHSKKVMHRDIKPDNILLDQNNDIIVGDLGIARMQEFTSQGGGTCAGTICYMSPQILQGQKYKDKTDVWSLGCVFHEVLSKRPPFSYTNLIAIINGPTPPMPSSYSVGLRTFILKVLDRNETTRPTAAKIFQDLMQLQGRPYYPRLNVHQQKEMVDTQCVFHALQLYKRGEQPEFQTTELSNNSISVVPRDTYASRYKNPKKRISIERSFTPRLRRKIKADNARNNVTSFKVPRNVLLSYWSIAAILLCSCMVYLLCIWFGVGVLNS